MRVDVLPPTAGFLSVGVCVGVTRLGVFPRLGDFPRPGLWSVMGQILEKYKVSLRFQIIVVLYWVCNCCFSSWYFYRFGLIKLKIGFLLLNSGILCVILIILMHNVKLEKFLNAPLSNTLY